MEIYIKIFVKGLLSVNVLYVWVFMFCSALCCHSQQLSTICTCILYIIQYTCTDRWLIKGNKRTLIFIFSFYIKSLSTPLGEWASFLQKVWWFDSDDWASASKSLMGV